MPPWGYTSVLPADYSELATLSKVAVDASINNGNNVELVFLVTTPMQHCPCVDCVYKNNTISKKKESCQSASYRDYLVAP